MSRNRFAIDKKEDASVWHVTLRIIQGRDLPSGRLKIKATLQEQQLSTRLVIGANPMWKQNLTFTLCGTDSSTISEQFLHLKLMKKANFQPKALAYWTLPISAIMELKHRTLNSKWIGLRSSKDEDQDDHCGFLKVSVSVWNGLESPQLLNDDLSSQDVWFTSVQENYNLRFRLFRITHIASELLDMFAKKTKLYDQMILEVSIMAGAQTIRTNQIDLINSDVLDHSTDVKLNQDVFLHFVWPTVISKISLRFHGIRGKNTTCLAEAHLKLQEIYRVGDCGFMPLFGPGYINFYTSNATSNSESQHQKYAFRLSCCIDTVDFIGSEGLRCGYSNVLHSNSEPQTKDDCYSIYCSFSTCNQMNPLFGSSNISFHVSIGNFGSVGTNSRLISSCTIGTMPVTDGHKYFSMPWGNHKPVAKFDCYFENIEYRMHASNAILKVCDMLNKLLKLIQRRSQNDAALASSYFIESLEHARNIIKRLELDQFEKITTDFDRKIESFRKLSYEGVLKEIDILRSSSIDNGDATAYQACCAITQLNGTLESLARDVQMSIPDIVIHMVADGKVVGYAHVPVQEVLFHCNDSYRGLYCGKTRALQLKWQSLDSAKNRLEEFVGILHAKIWFGNANQSDNLRLYIQPGELKYFTEVFQYEKKTLSKQWEPYGPEFTDEACSTISKGQNHKGHWMMKKTQEMWILADSSSTVADKIYQLEERIDGKWKHILNTDYSGAEMNSTLPPEGYKYEGKFIIDPHTNNNNHSGWVYSSHKQFSDNPFLDINDRPCYRYRRRCVTRIRKPIETKVETLERLKTEIGHKSWEYSEEINRAYHSTDLNDANYRRRIFFVEQDMKPDKTLSRMFEVHNCTTIWQLRCYILWAKDLLPLIKDTLGLFVRVTFLHLTTQTLVVRKSQNPIWNETLLFEKISIPGAINEICANPPIINIEVRGEKADNTELFLGSFQICPAVVANALDDRAKLEWNVVMYQKENSKGSLLSSFELFHVSQANSILPNEPSRKSTKSGRFDIPLDIKPTFQKYSVHLLCWGLRNINSNALQKVRKPYLKILVGNQDFKTDCIHNLNVNPNFPEPIVTFPEVHLPHSLELSPPIIISLYDSHSFARQRLLGICQLSSYSKYFVPFKKMSKRNLLSSWKAYDEAVAKELAKDKKTAVSEQDKQLESFDWWSKYYASQGNLDKAPLFLESGTEDLKILEGGLEDLYGCNGFSEFLDRFQFVRCHKIRKNYEEAEVVGELKGKLFISKSAVNSENDTIDPPLVEFMGPVKCCVRVYIIEASDLVSIRSNGLINPYIVVQCGEHQKSFRDFHVSDSCNPIFGQVAELNLTVPVQKDLQIHVMDYHNLFSDERIGSTSIDIEDRLFSKWRATVGLPGQYNKKNENWRDQMTPLEILKKYCLRMQIPEPRILESDGDVGLEVLGCELWFSKLEKELIERDGIYKNRKKTAAPSQSLQSCVHVPKCKSQICITNLLRSETISKASDHDQLLEARCANRKERLGSKLQNVALYVLNSMKLVPEHVETRTLFSQVSGKSECGRLRLFVDIFPMEYGPIPPPINVKPRKPIDYQIRVCIFNVANIIPNRQSFGQPITDLYVKVYLTQSNDVERTDVHYRADGYAEFNWRFLFNIKFDPYEKKIINSSKLSMFGKKNDFLVEPVLIVELWDKRRFRKDTKIGEMHFDITNFKEGYSDPHQIMNLRRRRKNCCHPRMCVCNASCCLTSCKTRKKTLPERTPFIAPEESMKQSLFDTDVCRGWWPVVSKIETGNNDALKKKNDDISHGYVVTGSVEIEFSLLTAEDAAQDPVGKNRKEPNHSPYLPKPYRSTWNTFYITSRVRPFFGWCCHAFAPQVLLWIIMGTLLFFTIYGFLSNWPLLLMQLFT